MPLTALMTFGRRFLLARGRWAGAGREGLYGLRWIWLEADVAGMKGSGSPVQADQSFTPDHLAPAYVGTRRSASLASRARRQSSSEF